MTSTGLGLAAVNDAAKAVALRRMKRLATSLLVLFAAIFAVAFALQHSYPWLEYVRAAAEGGMVGALADWFAVTALFKHPMGLKIPHTAIIPRKKDQIGESLGQFVQENFLSGDVVDTKLRELDVSRGVGTWLAKEASATRVVQEVSTVARAVLEVLDDRDILALLESLAKKHMLAPEWSSTLGRIMHRVVIDGHHKPAVDLLAERAGQWVDANRQMIVSLVAERSPSWVPAVVDTLLGEKLHREMQKFVRAVRENPHHSMRLSIDVWLEKFATDMQSDEEMIAKVEALKHSLLGDAQLRDLAATSWSSIKAALIDAMENPESELRKSMIAAIIELGGRLRDDVQLASKVNGWVSTAVRYVVENYRGQITSLITDTVARWDGKETSEKIELQVGRDLQFIRINGTVVGSLAGLVIFTVANALLR
ncbi:DUF445 domain-containing protein [Paeniglutamicibacter gangotriensis]|uniref:DUF445 domain-containing protein n=2 Tax=Paeniglutamicibacter gangotriensis TaxID=254787 RepID=A0A5B0E6Y2_9MICC|nr:DUF445 domain-containing protein [Paeniglutamicibacter gangotriensis]EMQ96951.1 putative membrane protein [Paeniglutamicibacter gangotriensis Lz1y]KAA0973540.1 DUF445 domain-containing protein [Paeniglutamicibacter gangotriensis]